MPILYKKSTKVALPPGTIRESVKEEETRLRVIDYTSEKLEERELDVIDEAFGYKDTPTVSWINIDGNDIPAIKRIDAHFGIHPLVLEDIVNREQRAKIEEYDNYIFLVMKMIYFDEAIDDIHAEQFSFILGKDFLLTFQERKGDVFEPVRDRLRKTKGKIRELGVDYLAYALLDAIVDHYFVVLEKIGMRIDELENQLMKEPTSEMPMKIYKLKTEAIFLRKQIWPLREVLSTLLRSETKLINEHTNIYLRDVYDHTIRVNDTLEAFRDAISGLHDIYLSTVSNKMNEIMKVLTIFSAVFIPLTFIAGIYGMNFEYIPELKFKNGYFVAIGVMFTLGVSMAIYFKNRKWL